MAVHATPRRRIEWHRRAVTPGGGQGHTTVLVTCTNGDLGDIKDPRASQAAPGSCRPSTPRGGTSCRAAAGRGYPRCNASLPLGYHDSGMHGWETNTEPHAFAQARVEEVTGQLVPIMRQHCPDVVVTYDEQGGYGHPDHIMAHRVTMAAPAAAADATRFPEAGTPWHVQKVYYTAWARSDALRALKMMHRLGQKTCLRARFRSAQPRLS